MFKQHMFKQHMLFRYLFRNLYGPPSRSPMLVYREIIRISRRSELHFNCIPVPSIQSYISRDHLVIF